MIYIAILPCKHLELYRRIVLVAIKDEASYKMKKTDYEYLKQIGAKDPIMSEHRGSFTLVGYSGPGRLSFIRQVRSYLFKTISIKANIDITQILLNERESLRRKCKYSNFNSHISIFGRSLYLMQAHADNHT